MGLNGVKAETSAPSGTQSPSEDMPEGLLSHEKLPLEIPEDNVGSPALMPPLPSSATGSRHPTGTPAGTPHPSSSGVASGGVGSLPTTPVMPGGPGQSGTPGLSGATGKWRGGSARPSPMSTATPGPRIQDPFTFTVTDRKVRVRDHEKDTPLYVLCRKWVQNDPEAELMPPKLLLLEETGDIVRESSAGSGVRGAGPKLPAVPAPSEEEERAERPAPEEPPLPQQQLETPTLEALKKHHQEHWLAVRQHSSKRFALKMQRFRNRLNTLLALSATSSSSEVA